MRRLPAGVALFVVMAAAGFMSPSAWAQNREKAWEINPYAGYMAFSKVEGEQAFNNTWDLGFRFGYNWT
ncbi:hypothetical protein, partial [Escherichia coli]|uniref:hypothetical protein n=1 Tax=Escherichia coli TaxID=562 RepID=UPI001412AD37